MKMHLSKSLLATYCVAGVLAISPVIADDGDMVENYVGDNYGQTWVNSYGECWRSRFEETTEKKEECGYKKEEPIVLEVEVVKAPTAVSVTAKVVEEIAISAKLLFGFDSDVLSNDAKAILDERIAKYKGKGELTSEVVVVGHTDSTGPEAYNQGLSERRAKSVAKYLEEHTYITDDEIDTVGKGESEPVASNDTKEGRAQNRRVVIQIQGELTKDAE